jgi:hypothetical protein
LYVCFFFDDAKYVSERKDADVYVFVVEMIYLWLGDVRTIYVESILACPVNFRSTGSPFRTEAYNVIRHS